MNKKIALNFCLLFLIATQSLIAQKKNTNFLLSTLSSSKGHWKGTLTYLDYSSTNSYTIPAEIDISYTSNKEGYIRAYSYPNEPHENSTDTTYTRQSGKYFGREKVTRFIKSNSRDFTLITEFNDVDGNDKKPATIRHKYQLEGTTFIIRMDVKFKSTTNWINRHEYRFTNQQKNQPKTEQKNVQKVVIQDKALYSKIKSLDSILFNAYNLQDLTKMKSYFTKELEWYEDNGGLLNYETVVAKFQAIFNKRNKISIELIKETLEVHPIKDFGAVENAQYKFHHMEDGKLKEGIFKFLIIWKNDRGNWKITRVVSFDH
jgi:Domain of unknown function (DUF4440)